MQLTKEEATLVLQLCDMALKQGGLSAVNTVLPLANKVMDYLKSQPETEVKQE